jgi:hypothetical protein
MNTSTADQSDMKWRAVCGVCSAAWRATMKDNDAVDVPSSFCPSCQRNGLIAPGVLHWKRDTVYIPSVLAVKELREPQALTARNAVASTFGMTGEEYEAVLGGES